MSIGRVTVGSTGQDKIIRIEGPNQTSITKSISSDLTKTIRIEGPTQTSISTTEKKDASHIIDVNGGGTGLNTVPLNCLLVGDGTDTLLTISSNNEGEVLVIGVNGKPEFSMLFGGTF